MSIALPSGSPICDIDDTFSKAHGAEDPNAGFSATVNQNGGSYTIRLQGKDTPIHGVLMYVSKDSDKSSRLGQFTPKDGFKFVSGCHMSLKETTITHGNSQLKKDNEFTWTPGPDDKGSFTLHAVVTGEKVPWQRLKVQLGDSSNQTVQTPSVTASASEASDTTTSTIKASVATTSTIKASSVPTSLAPKSTSIQSAYFPIPTNGKFEISKASGSAIITNPDYSSSPTPGNYVGLTFSGGVSLSGDLPTFLSILIAMVIL